MLLKGYCIAQECQFSVDVEKTHVLHSTIPKHLFMGESTVNMPVMAAIAVENVQF